ncbi:hypothetical protein CI610_02293 [invertebrate metagenome]|uniref:Uncharacterized protein n=1 Tax=invertebrate metagenome TaxID=1711999 RepID=A0A2H9T699_9ZZZZ
MNTGIVVVTVLLCLFWNICQSTGDNNKGDSGQLGAKKIQPVSKKECVIQILKDLGEIGVYIDVSEHSLGLGDLSASVQLIQYLAYLKVPRIHVWISATEGPYEADQPEDLQKMALLLPGYCPDKKESLFFWGSSEVKVTKRCIKETMPSVALSFRDGDSVLAKGELKYEDFITIKPYCFGLPYRYFLSQSVEDYHRELLNIPDEGVIPGDSPLTDFYLGYEEDPVEWIYQCLINNRSMDVYRHSGCREQPEKFNKLESCQSVYVDEKSKRIAQLIDCLLRESREDRIAMGFVYGIHHSSLVGDVKMTGLYRWIRANRSVAEERGTPSVLIVFGINDAYRRVLVQEFKRSFRDVRILSYENEDNLNQGIKSLNEGKGELFICLLTSISQPVFRMIIERCCLPALVEGANTTSILLQKGLSYLSLLPCGNTPVSFELGDALESFRVQGLSCRLFGNEREDKELESLIEKIEKGDYQSAREWIIELKNSEPPSPLDFLWKQVFIGKRFSDSPVSENQRLVWEKKNVITVLSLLEKEMRGELSDEEKNRISLVIGGLDACLIHYIKASLNPDSSLSRHFQTIKERVCSDEYNNVVSALYQWGKYKGYLH